MGTGLAIPMLMSIVNWGEVYYSLYRSKGIATAEEALMVIEQLPLTIVELGRSMKTKQS